MPLPFRVLLSILLVLSIWGCKKPAKTTEPIQSKTVKTDPSKLAEPCVSMTGADGEGCAEIDISSVVSGDLDRFTITYTAGKTGIPVGGSVAIGLHHGSKWPFQFVSPDAANFVSVSNSSGVALKLSKGNFRQMFSGERQDKFSNAIFWRIIRAQVTTQPIEPGEKVTFTFGANEKLMQIQSYTDLQHEIRVSTDIDGDGKFARIADEVMFSVVSNDATQFTATAPSQVLIGEPFDIIFRADDAYYNIDQFYNDAISVVDESGETVIKNLQFVDGIANATLSIDTKGPQRLRMSSVNGKIKGRSNPFRVMEILPKNKIFWGDIHGHTGVSDGLGRSVDNYFIYGRDVAALDVIALTDHGHPDWENLKTAVQKYHDPGKYVTILAQEASAGPDHMNIYLRRDDADHIAVWQTDYVKFQNWLINQYNKESNEAQTAPHHFAYDRQDKGSDLYPFGHWDTRVARFIELYSSHGTSEFEGNPRPLPRTSSDTRKYMQWGLDQGLRFGIIGASDNHNSKPGHSWWGNYPNGLAAFVAPELSRDAIWNSLWNRQTYATSFDRIYMDITLNGEPMGSDLKVDGDVRFKGYIIGKTDEISVSLLRDNELVWGKTTDNGVIEFTYEDDVPDGEHHYYFRVEQSNGERAWSSPFWVN